jgi:hypothetical protein
LQFGIHSKSRPWANLDKRLLYTAYLGQLSALYDLEDELSSVKKLKDKLTRNEMVYSGCKPIQFVDWFNNIQFYSIDPHSILRTPHNRTFQPDERIRSKIAGYFHLVMQGYGCGKRRKDIQTKLPEIMPSWGKVRIAGGGDYIQAASASNKIPERDCSWVRVSITFTVFALKCSS